MYYERLWNCYQCASNHYNHHTENVNHCTFSSILACSSSYTNIMLALNPISTSTFHKEWTKLILNIMVVWLLSSLYRIRLHFYPSKEQPQKRSHAMIFLSTLLFFFFIFLPISVQLHTCKQFLGTTLRIISSWTSSNQLSRVDNAQFSFVILHCLAKLPSCFIFTYSHYCLMSQLARALHTYTFMYCELGEIHTNSSSFAADTLNCAKINGIMALYQDISTEKHLILCIGTVCFKGDWSRQCRGKQVYKS